MTADIFFLCVGWKGKKYHQSFFPLFAIQKFFNLKKNILLSKRQK